MNIASIAASALGIVLCLYGCDRTGTGPEPAGDGTWTREQGTVPQDLWGGGKILANGETFLILGGDSVDEDRQYHGSFRTWDPATGKVSDPNWDLAHLDRFSGLPIDSFVYVIAEANWSDGPTYPYVIRFSVPSLEWKAMRLPPFPPTDHPHQPVRSGDRVFFFDAYPPEPSGAQPFLSYNISSDSWDKLTTNMPAAMQRGFAAECDGKLYVIEKTGGKGDRRLVVGMLSPPAFSWHELYARGVGDDYGFQAVDLGAGKILLAEDLADHPGEGIRTRILDLKTMAFSDFGVLPVASDRYQLVTAKGKVYLFGVPRKGSGSGFSGIFSRAIL